MIPADLAQSLAHTIYTTFSHNQVVLGYLGGFFLSAGLAIWRPNRFSILLLLGFGVLGFGYEYDKHLVGPLTRQTLQVIIENPAQHLRAQRYLNTFLGEVLPVLFYFCGWGLIYLGIILGVGRFPAGRNTQVEAAKKEEGIA